MTDHRSSDQGNDNSKQPPLLDQEALKTFMARNPSPGEAIDYLLHVLSARARLEAILDRSEPGEQEDS
jgi:hypothetical protein